MSGQTASHDHADAVLEAVFLADLTPAIRSQAGRLTPWSLRTLDAIHVATAVSLSLPDLAVGGRSARELWLRGGDVHEKETGPITEPAPARNLLAILVAAATLLALVKLKPMSFTFVTQQKELSRSQAAFDGLG